MGSQEPQLQISPGDLRFRFEPRKNIPITLSLHNPTSERIAFKVKTTSPKKYCVRPSSGFVEPSSGRDVQVIMQAQKEFSGQGECKDKFLVQYVFASPDVTEARAGELFENGRANNVRQAKLRVVLQGPAKPPSPVPEGIEEEMASPVKAQSPQGMLLSVLPVQAAECVNLHAPISLWTCLIITSGPSIISIIIRATLDGMVFEEGWSERQAQNCCFLARTCSADGLP